MPKVRSLLPGEFVQNPDGSRSTERTVTVTHPNLNNGRPTLIPTIYMKDGKIIELDLNARNRDDLAVELALQSKQNFPTFGSIEEADDFARARSNRAGAFQGQLGGMRGPVGAVFE